MNIDKDLTETLNDFEKMYNFSVYDVNYINEILFEMECPITRFSITKLYELNTIYYKIAFNDRLVFAFYTDPYNPFLVYIGDKDTKRIADMLEEAREKIRSKYLTYIARLEDTLQLPFNEILKLELNL